jgi:hypothetical protein
VRAAEAFDLIEHGIDEHCRVLHYRALRLAAALLHYDDFFRLILACHHAEKKLKDRLE